MPKILIAVLLVLLLGGAAGAAPPVKDGEADRAATSRVEEMQKRMLNDPGILEIILALQNDPDMQALVNDPKLVAAAQAGDLGPLLSDPRFLKLLDNSRVREIQQRVTDRKGEGGE